MPDMNVTHAAFAGLDLLASAVLLIDEHQAIRYINAAGENLLTVSSRGIVGKTVGQVCRISPTLQAALENGLHNNWGYTGQNIELKRGDGETLHLNCTVTPLHPEVAGGMRLLLELQPIEHHLAATREERLIEQQQANRELIRNLAHEIKNPLASLRSAVASMHFAKRDDQRLRLLEVIDHDVRRLDRLVSDISNASRLDSELVKEQEEEFNLVTTLTNLCDFLGQQAAEKGVEFITDFPSDPVRINGLEGRLAQVFVNLITNAVSFCEDGDAVRIWARRRDNRVLVVVEDTGPGIPEQALTKVFKRFYSERPQGQFGEHSGLGLAISKQIVEAHGGVIWAENIRPTHADITSEPLGARFVVGLPV